MKLGRAIAAGTMAMGAYRAYKEYKGTDAPKRGRGRGGKVRSHSRAEKKGWFGGPFSSRH